MIFGLVKYINQYAIFYIFHLSGYLMFYFVKINKLKGNKLNKDKKVTFLELAHCSALIEL